MKVKDARIDSTKYAMIKNKVYRIYINDVLYPEDNKIAKLYDAIEKYDIPAFHEIVDDTIEFPYDKELYAFYKRNLSMKIHDFILTASNIFGIDSELVVSKIREYNAYDFDELVKDGLIDSKYVDTISNMYIERNKEKNK